MQKRLLAFLCVSVSIEFICVSAQLSYVLYSVSNGCKNVNLTMIGVMYFLQITNVYGQHLIFIWTWKYQIKHYVQSLSAAREQE